MSYYIVDEEDRILDGCNSPVAAEIKAKEISRREGIITYVITE